VVQPLQQTFLVPPQQPAPSLLSDVNTVRASSMGDAQARTTVLRYQIEFHQKFAIPLACFCFVLLGMSVALKFPNSGIGLVIGGSLVIFLGFYILLQGGKGVALSGRLDPVITMYTPLVLFTLLGLLTLSAADREMGTARSAGPFDRIINLYHRLRR
jgi:lipopolysaccharide export LptBFGC system permease protein LptF